MEIEDRQEIARQIGDRLKLLLKERGLGYKDVEVLLGGKVPYKTISGYCTGKNQATPGFLRAISEALKVSTDWLLKGEGEMYLTDEYEIEALRTFRRARELGVGEDVKRFADFTVQQKLKGMEKEPPDEERILDLIVISEGLDTVGKRLQYAREALVGQKLREMAKTLGLSPEELTRIEEGKARPAPSFFTTFNSHYGQQVNLDWLLTGKSGK